MIDRDHTDLVAPYRMVRELGESRVGPRWVAIDERTGETRAVYLVGSCRDTADRRRTLGALEAVGSLHHAHLLGVEQFTLDRSGRAWAVTAYRGNQEGLVTIADLVEAKGGRLSVTETLRTLEQLLDAIAAGHGAGVIHGPLEAREVLVDRHGSVWVELYGLARRLQGLVDSNELLVRDEVRSIAALGYRLLTGLDAEEPRMAASRMFKKLDRAWDRWFDRGLDAGEGFATAREALDALPGHAGAEADLPTIGTRPVRRVIERFRRSPTGR